MIVLYIYVLMVLFTPRGSYKYAKERLLLHACNCLVSNASCVAKNRHLVCNLVHYY
jgi:hypothetical protein